MMNKKIDTLRPELYPIPVKSPWYHTGMDFVGPISPQETDVYSRSLTTSKSSHGQSSTDYKEARPVVDSLHADSKQSEPI